ncbi:MAG: N-ATPase subunit AtpR [Planctomycetota bacterium]
MHEALILVLACVAGGALGAAFFAGLWWTVRHRLSSNHPALWILGSLVARTAMLLVGFYYIAGGHWQRLLACVVGFVTAKLVATRLAMPPKGVSHAP